MAQLKVGDRVRFVDDTPFTGDGLGTKQSKAQIYRVVETFDNGWCRVILGDIEYSATTDELEPYNP